MGVILGSGVAPIALCVTWSKANKWGCIGGAIAGFFAGIIAWLVTTSTLNNGVINVTVFFLMSPLTAQCLTWCFVFRPVGVSLVLIPVDNVVDIFLQGTTKCWPETWHLLG